MEQEKTGLVSNILDLLSSEVLGFKFSENEHTKATLLIKQEMDKMEEVKLIQKIKHVEDQVQHLQEEITLDSQKEEAIKKYKSLIISLDNFTQIIDWLGPEWRYSKFKLIYRGTTHGLNAKAFHDYCNNKGPTITIMKSNYGKVFGGFNPESWTSRQGWIATNQSFLFSITSKENEKHVCLNQNYAIYDHPDHGPNFGGSLGLYISSNFLSTSNVCNQDLYDFEDAKTLTGATSFQLTEIEVYSLEKTSGDLLNIEKELSQINQTTKIKNERLEGLEKKLAMMKESVQDKLLKEKAEKEEAEKSSLEQRMNAKKEIIEQRKEQKAKEEKEAQIQKRVEASKEDLTMKIRSGLTATLKLEESENNLNKIKIEYEEIQSYKNKSPEEECLKIQTQIDELAVEIFEIEGNIGNMKHKEGEETKTTSSDEERSLFTQSVVKKQEKTDLVKKLQKELEKWKNSDEWVKDVENRYKIAQKETEDTEKEKESTINQYKEAQKELKDAQSAQEAFEQEQQADAEKERVMTVAKRQMEIDKRLEQMKVQVQEDMAKLREKLDILGRTIQIAICESNRIKDELSSLGNKQPRTFLRQIEEEVDFDIEKEKYYRKTLEAEIDNDNEGIFR